MSTPANSAAMSRRQLLASAAGVGAAVLLPDLVRGQPTRDGGVRHVCLILMEDMGVQIGPYGDRTVPTPRLDALADEGCVFERAYCTSPTCSPSRSSLFTGLYPHQNGHLGLASVPGALERGQAEFGWELHPGTPTLVGQLDDANFASMYTYKLHVQPEASIPFDRAYTSEDFKQRGGGLNHGRIVGEITAEFAREHRDQRLFLMPQSTDTHRPFTWTGGGHNAPLTDEPGLPYVVKTADDDLLLPHFGPDMPRDPALLGDVADYYNAVQRVDRLVGEVSDQLDELGIAGETLVIFASDHGPAMVRGKCSVYELGVRVPLIVRWPGVSRRGTRVERPVSLVDVMPTILDAAGLPTAEYLAGRSWRDLLAGGGGGDDREACVVSEYHAHTTMGHWWPSRTITDGRYKLNLHLLVGRGRPAGQPAVTDRPPDLPIGRNAPEGTVARQIYRRFLQPPRVELFDLRDDPHEYHDLGDDDSYDAEKQRLLAALADWQRRTNDPFRDEAYLDAYTAHYRALEDRAQAWAKESGKSPWSRPDLISGDHTRFARPFEEVRGDLLAAKAGDPPAVVVPPPDGGGA